MELSEYVKAGKIAAKVRENVKKLDLVGKNYLEICEYVEKSIIDNLVNSMTITDIIPGTPPKNIRNIPDR